MRGRKVGPLLVLLRLVAEEVVVPVRIRLRARADARQIRILAVGARGRGAARFGRLAPLRLLLAAVRLCALPLALVLSGPALLQGCLPSARGTQARRTAQAYQNPAS